MKLQDAKKFYDHEDEQPLACDRTDCDGSMVKWEGDKVCDECGYMYDAEKPAHIQDQDVLLAERCVVKFRNRGGSGYYGPDRVRFAGGFFRAWFDGDGSLDL